MCTAKRTAADEQTSSLLIRVYF